MLLMVIPEYVIECIRSLIALSVRFDEGTRHLLGGRIKRLDNVVMINGWIRHRELLEIIIVLGHVSIWTHWLVDRLLEK